MNFLFFYGDPIEYLIKYLLETERLEMVKTFGSLKNYILSTVSITILSNRFEVWSLLENRGLSEYKIFNFNLDQPPLVGITKKSRVPHPFIVL